MTNLVPFGRTIGGPRVKRKLCFVARVIEMNYFRTSCLYSQCRHELKQRARREEVN